MRGHLSCPGCRGRLRPWGWARSRRVRDGIGGGQYLVGHRPRRGRCTGCGVTHVLLAVSLAARRADTAEVIAAAIEDKVVGGHGHRVIATRLGRPASTVQGWLRAFAASAAPISAMFTWLIQRDAPDAAGIFAGTGIGGRRPGTVGAGCLCRGAPPALCVGRHRGVGPGRYRGLRRLVVLRQLVGRSGATRTRPYRRAFPTPGWTRASVIRDGRALLPTVRGGAQMAGSHSPDSRDGLPQGPGGEDRVAPLPADP